MEVDYSKEDGRYNLADDTIKVWVYTDGSELIGTWEGKVVFPQ